MAGTVLALLLMALFGRLGMWQLDRAGEKRALLAQFEAGKQSTIELRADNAARLPRYQQILARGHYDAAHQVLLDNMPSAHGQPGYRVLTPFQLSGEEAWILVDRGWLPLGRTREDLPTITVKQENRTITGRLDRLPQPGLRMGEAGALPKDTWPRVLSFPRIEDLQRTLQRDVFTHLVLLDPSNPDGYERSAQMQLRFGPERHVAYAVQWFALMIAVAVVYLVVSLKSERSST